MRAKENVARRDAESRKLYKQASRSVRKALNSGFSGSSRMRKARYKKMRIQLKEARRESRKRNVDYKRLQEMVRGDGMTNREEDGYIPTIPQVPEMPK